MRSWFQKHMLGVFVSYGQLTKAWPTGKGNSGLVPSRRTCTESGALLLHVIDHATKVSVSGLRFPLDLGMVPAALNLYVA